MKTTMCQEAYDTQQAEKKSGRIYQNKSAAQVDL